MADTLSRRTSPLPSGRSHGPRRDVRHGGAGDRLSVATGRSQVAAGRSQVAAGGPGAAGTGACSGHPGSPAGRRDGAAPTPSDTGLAQVVHLSRCAMRALRGSPFGSSRICW